MSLTAALSLLQAALMLLTLAHGPQVPQSLRDTATQVAQQAIAVATDALNHPATAASVAPEATSTSPSVGGGTEQSTSLQSSAIPTPTQTPTTAQIPVMPRVVPKYWFAPLPTLPVTTGRPYTGSLDFMSLFDTNASWTTAANHIQVFKLYGEWLLPGNATDDQLKQVVSDLKRRGIALAVEAGPLDPTADCGNGIEGFAGSQWDTFFSRIKAAGGTIDYIGMDEPYYYAHVYSGTQACHWSADTIAQKVKAFTARAKAQFPNVVVGDTEPLVVGNAAAFGEWYDAFKNANGFALPFEHLDVQWSDTNWAQEARAVEDMSRSKGVTFGMIYDADNQMTDQEWIQTAGDHIKTYELQSGGHPDQVLFQSWNDKPDYNLPETTPYTFTNYINSYFGDKTQLGHQTPIPAGLFMVGTAVFYSNGSHYCLYDNWNNFMALTGLNTTSGIQAYTQIPSNMINDGVCTGVRNLALGKAATASGEVSGSEAAKAVDGDVTSKWVSGGSAPQWIQVDLGAAHSISEIKLLVEQTPAGQTTHVVSGSADGTTWQTITTFTGITTAGQMLDYTLPQPITNIRYVKISTTASPSWVAWREIQVLGQ